MKLTKQELQEEQDILDALEADKLESIEDLETARLTHQKAAANTFKNDASQNKRN